jgi:diguanylate cyclase (GGDEF)-like protein
VVPLYYENAFIGVLGMDFDYTVLTEDIHRIKIYEHGFAHLELNGVVIHDTTENSTGNSRFQTDRDNHLRSSRELANGMTLVLSASYDDIRQIRYDIAYEILLIILLFVLIFSCLVIWTVKKIVKPLKKLTDASIKLSKGDYDVEIAHSDTLEINLLSTTFENMIVNLREHKDLQHRLAHRDSLTGLRNTTSYKGWVVEFDKKIREGNLSFGILVLDINNLKEINDTYGHTLGNELIVAVSHIISDTFKRSPVFRIGGDEFLVLLQNKDLADMEELFINFDLKCAATHIDKGNVSLPISIAKGFSRFDPSKDTQFSNVFERADNEMYKHKREMKTLRP